MSILVAGGAGYIGSHTCVELINAGYDVVVVDNLSNSKKTSIERVETITGRSIAFYEADIQDMEALCGIFRRENIDAVINFAGLKAVGESVEKPLLYYSNNITGMLNLLHVMDSFNVKNIIFSSSATVYGDVMKLPIDETFRTGNVMNPYGQTKLMLEQVLVDLHNSDPEWNVVLLRYFNPIGAHKSGLIGEDPCGAPNNLLPYISQVAVGKRTHLEVFGDDYPTIDGTGVRDYIHVVDLAKGHVSAMQKLQPGSGLNIYNLGTGRGYSVFELLHAFEKACGREVPYVITARRSGDIAECYCDPVKAREELGWSAEKTLEEMCEDAWRWQRMNPEGYED